MKEISYSRSRIAIIIACLVLMVLKTNGQSAMPEVFTKESLDQQMNYLEKNTRIYEDYRAIREDMFQKLILNASDSLSKAKAGIAGLNSQVSVLNNTIDTLNARVEATNTKLEELTKTKNSIPLLGIEVDKSVYNSVMWIIVFGLLIVFLIGFLIFKRNLSVTISTKKELRAFIDEFEAYRKTSQQARDKLYMDHERELRKLREKGI